MRVCVDIQAAVTQGAGVGRYARTLVRYLERHMPACAELRLAYFDFLRGGKPLAGTEAETKAIRWVPGRAVNGMWRTLQWPPYDWFSGKADVFHFTNFLIPPLSSGKAVVTIYDMSFMRLPDAAEERNVRHLQAGIRKTVERADVIITISEFSASEIVDVLGVDRSRIHVTYPGIEPVAPGGDPARAAEVRRSLGIERPYVLFVGTIEPRKNIGFLIEVFERMNEFDGQLVIVGALGWKYGPIVERMRSSARARDIRHLDHVSDGTLPALYAGAELFLFPSLYEGFGFPPLEAMAYGTPVVSSAGGSLAEVLGDAAVVIPEADAENWAERAVAAIGDKVLAERGRQHAAKYKWEETARKTWEIYTQVADETQRKIMA